MNEPSDDYLRAFILFCRNEDNYIDENVKATARRLFPDLESRLEYLAYHCPSKKFIGLPNDERNNRNPPNQ